MNEKNPAEKSSSIVYNNSKIPEGFFDDAYKDAKVCFRWFLGLFILDFIRFVMFHIKINLMTKWNCFKKK